MDGRWSQLVQTGTVLPRAVAFVSRQPITRINSIKLHHQTVASYLSYDGGTGNREAQTITISYPLLRQCCLGQAHIVDKKALG